MFDHLLSTGRIGSMELRNRIVMSPMGSNLAEADGHLGERILNYYEERARGGAGLLIVGVGAIAFPVGACNPNQVAISDDVYLPGLRDLCARVHGHGAKIAIQLQHAGKVALRDLAEGRKRWVPTALREKSGDLTRDLTASEMQSFTAPFVQKGAVFGFHEMTRDDIHTVIDQFAAAADRARRAGFDGVELHVGHGYILSSFLSEATNKRKDEYGGPVENRARMLVETLQAVRTEVGPNFPVWCRLDGVEFHTEGGISEADARRTAELAAEAGADAIHVSAYADASIGRAFTDAPLVHEPAGYRSLAAGIKRAVDVPVIAVGRIEPDVGNTMIERGEADFVAMARKLLADPELPAKLEAGRPDDVRPCIYCYTCVGNIFLNGPSRCAVNPASGREFEMPLDPAVTPRSVLVVGGGPAGLEVARLSALRGHTVTLCESESDLGGTARFSALVAPENEKLVRWLVRQVRALPIDVRMNMPVTPETVREMAPDVTLIATGARRDPPGIPGDEQRHVLAGDDLRALLLGTDADVSRRKLSLAQRMMVAAGRSLSLTNDVGRLRRASRMWMPIGHRVVVIGGGLVGVELAEFLHARGREVTIVEEGAILAAEMAPPRRWRALHALRIGGVRCHVETKVREIRAKTVVIEPGEGEALDIEADNVILATGTRGDSSLADALGPDAGQVHVLGDAGGVGYILGAMLDAAKVARTI